MDGALGAEHLHDVAEYRQATERIRVVVRISEGIGTFGVHGVEPRCTEWRAGSGLASFAMSIDVTTEVLGAVGGSAPRAEKVVLVTGASWPLGRRVVERLRANGGYDVREIQRGRTDIVDLADDERCDVIVHLAPGDHDALASRGRSAAVGTPEVLAGASRHRTRHFVLLSSAMVYGAWPNNPVPLTEDAALRPDFGFAFT